MASSETGNPPPQKGRALRHCFLRCAEWADRALTWGLDPQTRAEILQERVADRYAHLADPDASIGAVAMRALRSALSDVGYRIFGHDDSAVPIGLVFALIGFGAFIHPLTSDMPFWAGIASHFTGAAFLFMGAVAIVSPRELPRVWLLPGLLVASAGTMGGALTLPASPGAVAVVDLTNRLGLAFVSVALLVLAMALMRPPVKRPLLNAGGAVLWAGALVMAVGQIGWAVLGAGFDATGGVGILVAAACIVGAAILSRLRDVPITS
jgi:hypothetical protein